MSAGALALRCLCHRPGRLALGILGVAAIGALLLDMLLLSRGFAVSVRRVLDTTGYDARAAASAALPTFGPPLEGTGPLLARLRAEPVIRAALALRFERGTLALDAGREALVGVLGADGPPRGAWRVVEGRDLASAAPGSALATRDLARHLGIGVGSALVLRGRCREAHSAPPPLALRVIGVVETGFDRLLRGSLLVSLGDLAAACGDDARDPAHIVLLASDGDPDAAVAAARAVAPGLDVSSNHDFADGLGQREFAYFRQMSRVLGLLAVVCAVLLVSTLLGLFVRQQLGELAALRAIGTRRRTLAGLLAVQAGLLVGLGGVAALPIALALARRLDATLHALPGTPAALEFFAFEPSVLAAYAGVLGAAAALGTLPPIRLAARIPVSETLRRESLT
jgi:hypothetical protein